MKTQLQIIKELVKKYPNDMELGAIVRQMITEENWKKSAHYESNYPLKAFDVVGGKK